MKVLWVTGSFFPTNSGGMDTIMHWIALCLKKQNVDLTLLTSDEATDGKVESNRWYQTNFGNIKYVPTRIHYLPIRLIMAAFRILPKHDNVHLCNIFYPSSIAVATLAVLWNKKVIWSVHGELDPWAIKHRTYKKKPFLWFIDKFLKNHVVFHTTCEEEETYVKNIFGKKTQTLLLTNYILLPKKEIVPRQRYLLFVGRIHPKKGLDLLIKALDKSDIFKNSDFILKIVGDYNNDHGRDLIVLTQQLNLKNKIHFLGKKEGTGKFRHFAESYFTIMPSITENFGMVVVESMSQGTPVIASTGTPWKILEETKAGLLVVPQVKDLTISINHILSLGEEDYSDYRKNAYALVCDKFDMEKNIQDWVEAYQSVFQHPTNFKNSLK